MANDGVIRLFSLDDYAGEDFVESVNNGNDLPSKSNLCFRHFICSSDEVL